MNKKLKLEELNRPSVEEFKNSKKTPIVIVLDNIRSLHNIGSIFRTADAFAIEQIILCGITAQPPHREITKSALGATKSVSWKYFEKTIDVIHELKNLGYYIISVEQTENSISLEKISLVNSQKCALIFGNEVDGVEQEAINQSDITVELAQFGTKHSLNVSVCAGIVLWELKKFYT
ncbi:MAG: RNA methyltransferase [Bacteroidia bacterium]